MTHDTYKYRFDESVPAQELEDTFMLVMLAVESLHGRSRMRMDSRFNLDKDRYSHSFSVKFCSPIGMRKIREFVIYLVTQLLTGPDKPYSTDSYLP